jgi:AcrR family transcriptional regulator
VQAAERLVAERGLHGVRVSEVVKEAGQRNNSAVTYHFGSWEKLLFAVWDSHTVPINIERAALIADARDHDRFDLPAMVSAYLDPLVADMARHSPSYWARFSEQWLATINLDYLTLDAEAEADQPRTESVMVVHALLMDIRDSLHHLPEDSRDRRVALMGRYVIGALAAWEREDEPAVPLDDLRRELLSTALALLQAQ